MKTISTQFTLELLGVSVGCFFAGVACFLGTEGVNPLIIGIVLWFGWFFAFFLMTQTSNKQSQLTTADYFYCAGILAFVLLVLLAVLNLVVFGFTAVLPGFSSFVNALLSFLAGLFAFVTASLWLYVVAHGIAGGMKKTDTP